MGRIWRDSETVCALADDERHLGHVVLTNGLWFAFDATHFNEKSNGYRLVGSFISLSTAKEALLSQNAEQRETARVAA